MSIPSRDEAKDTLHPYHALIWRVINEAWDECRSVQAMRTAAGMEPLLYHRTICNDVFDAIARRAIPIFGADPRVNVDIEAQTFKLFFGGILVARFKKGGDDKLGRNVPTQAAMAFMEADGVLPGMPPETAKVEFIWLPNELWTKIETVLVVARDGDRLIWEYEIDGPSVADLISLPSTPPSPAPSSTEDGDLVKPKARPGEKPVRQ